MRRAQRRVMICDLIRSPKRTLRCVLELMTLWPIIRHALAYGAVLSGIVCPLLLGLLWSNPEILLNDYPPDVRAKYGPMSERSKRQRLPVALFLGAVGLSVVAASFVDVRENSGGHIPFLTALVHLFVMFSLF